MHALKLITAALAAAFSVTAVMAQSVTLFINGQPLAGATTLGEVAADLSNLPALAPGDVFQTQVVFTDLQGGSVNYTGTPRVHFQALGCLTITPGGLLTVPALGDPSDVCRVTFGLGVLWVYILDETGANILAGNGYFFRVPQFLGLEGAPSNPPPPPPPAPPPPANPPSSRLITPGPPPLPTR